MIDNKSNIATKKMCFVGWFNFYKQKKMLKKCLHLEEEYNKRDISFYPKTVEEKNAFEDIKQSWYWFYNIHLNKIDQVYWFRLLHSSQYCEDSASLSKLARKLH